MVEVDFCTLLILCSLDEKHKRCWIWRVLRKLVDDALPPKMSKLQNLSRKEEI